MVCGVVVCILLTCFISMNEKLVNLKNNKENKLVGPKSKVFYVIDESRIIHIYISHII